MSHRPGYYREYYSANRERERARKKKWRDDNIERYRKVEAAWRKAHPESVAAKLRKYRQKPESKAKDAAAHRAKRKADPEKVRATDRAYYAKAVARKRVQARISHAKSRLRKGKAYRPLFHMRLPEWAAACQRAWAKSPWLPENRTSSQEAWARELMIEQGQWRWR